MDLRCRNFSIALRRLAGGVRPSFPLRISQKPVSTSLPSVQSVLSALYSSALIPLSGSESATQINQTGPVPGNNDGENSLWSGVVPKEIRESSGFLLESSGKKLLRMVMDGTTSTSTRNLSKVVDRDIPLLDTFPCSHARRGLTDPKFVPEQILLDLD